MDDWGDVDFSMLRRMKAPDRQLRIGALETQYDAFNCFRNLPSKPCPKPGAEVEIMTMVLQMLGWNWTLIDLHKEYGISRVDYGQLQSNGSFTGVMGLLQQDKIDAFALSMRITASRMNAACFSYPIHISTQVYIIEAPKGIDFRYFMFSVVSLNVWLVIFGTILILIGFQTVISVYEDTCKRSLFEKCTRAAMDTLGVFFRQRNNNPRSHTEMVLQGFMLLAMLVIYVYYQSAMNSKLTAPSKPAIPFRTQSQLLDLVEENDFHLFYYLNQSMDCSNEVNCERMPSILRTNPVHVIDGREKEQFREEFHRNGVYLATHDIDLIPYDVSWYNHSQRTIMIKDPKGLHYYMAFAFNLKNRLYKNVFNRALIKILPGIPTIKTGPGYHERLKNYFASVKIRKHSLTLERHLEQLFVVFFVGCGMSVAVLLLEILVHKSKINERIAQRCDRKMSGVYIGGLKTARWFPGYNTPDGIELAVSRYTSTNYF